MELVDALYFVFGNPLLDKFSFQLIISIEDDFLCRTVGMPEEVEENTLRPADILCRVVPLLDFDGTTRYFTVRVFGKRRLNKAHICRRLCSGRIRDKRNRTRFLFLLAGKTIVPQIGVSEVAHEGIHVRRLLDDDFRRLPVLQRRALHFIFQVFRKNDVRDAAEEHAQLLKIREFGKTVDALILAGGVRFRHVLDFAEHGRELVECFTSIRHLPLRREIPDHVPRFGKRIRDGRSGRKEDVAAARLFLDFIQFDGEVDASFARFRVQSFDTLHVRNKERFFVGMRLVNEDRVYAEFVEIESLVLLRGFSLDLLQFLLERENAPLNISLGHAVFCCFECPPQFVDERLIIGRFRFRGDVEPVELALRKNNQIPFVVRDFRDCPLSVLLREIVLIDAEDFCRRIQRRGARAELANRRILYHDKRLLRHLRADKFHCRSNHGVRLPGADAMRQ